MKNNWPDNLTIQQYLDGSLDKKLMHELEKRALEDPFLADALDGFSQNPTADHGLSILQRQLHERIMHQQENKKVFDLSWQRLSIAAAAAVGRLLRLSPDEMLDAFGSAGTQAAGLWEFLRDAADSKQLHTAKAAANGMMAAYLAQPAATTGFNVAVVP